MSRALQIVGLMALAAGLPGLEISTPLSWLSAGLLLLAALKLAEARSLPERRLVSLLILIGGGVQGAQQPELLPSLLQMLATGAGLAGLLALELGAGLSWRTVVRRSLAVLMAALPVALLLFLLVPRVSPLWPAPSLRGPGAAAVTGLSSELDPGSIATLANDNAPAARVSFSGNAPPEPGERYWRVVVHERFDGQRWFQLPPPAKPTQPQTGGPSGRSGASQVWLVEPSPVQALPWAGRGRAAAGQLRVSPSGELQLQQPGMERQAYLLRDTETPQPWQQRPPSPVDLALPAGSNPQLEALGASWRALPTPEQRVNAAQIWFSQGAFRYSRSPGTLPPQRGLDVFLFERREGFCGHYASAFTALMRAAGVPARVVSGYLGGTWVRPLGGAPYLDLRRSEAHAWSEVWLAGRGWQRVDPSIWAGAAQTGTASPLQLRDAHSGHPAGWLQWLQWQWWGLDLAWSRWWLGFDQAGQEALLQRLFGDQRQGLGALVLAGAAALLALGLTWLQGLRQPRRPQARRRQLNRVLQRLQRQGLCLQPGETLDALAQRAQQEQRAQAPRLQHLAATYNQLRFAPLDPSQRLRAEARWHKLIRELGTER